MKICFIGTGYVGLVSGVCFSDLGNSVICIDKDREKLTQLENGDIPIFEPGLSELVRKNLDAGRLSFSDDLIGSIKKSDIVFIAVGTPTAKDGVSADLSQVFSVAKLISKGIKSHKIIVTKSTVPIGTGDKIEKILNKNKKKGLFTIISNPEFLREGEAIKDFKYPDRVVIGTNDKRVIKIFNELYRPIINKGAAFVSCSRRAAELIKYASNAFLATKISFINEIANLCEKVHVNIDDVSVGIGLDKRIGSRFLRAGPAYGGSCFPKDTKALAKVGKNYNSPLSIVNSVINFNEKRKKDIENNIYKILHNKIKNKIICFLGVTFKANTDDLRDSSAINLISKFVKKGAKINYYEPTGSKEILDKHKNVKYFDDLYLAVKKVDLIIIHTEWDEFKNLNFSKIKNNNKKVIIYDLRNLYDNRSFINKNNISYYSIGRPFNA
ncbi:MAG: UDP-glucose/GDP-mannose dehydrogenase family protein [Proteobacteria bacterium]|jgi:UDPglucose 6-dehydrogenase|nr:UDP-glucose/GDP-mannose dehydrogenase family protein [Candidatus Fonsibacter ubiquis]NDB47688.1 UDP-glucose/GDP-mannose dehydrogenase family protein [Pseudomonadota bacterium]NDD06126.1 UDP-glucose/GDP-mannose dehydrogenase family protein [Pseudomonadota bacterium]